LDKLAALSAGYVPDEQDWLGDRPWLLGGANPEHYGVRRLVANGGVKVQRWAEQKCSARLG
jgi:hypothetical protein